MPFHGVSEHASDQFEGTGPLCGEGLRLWIIVGVVDPDTARDEAAFGRGRLGPNRSGMAAQDRNILPR